MELFLSPAACSAALPSAWLMRWAALLPTGATVLDLACGSGRHARWLADRGHPVTALDRDAAALAGLRGLQNIDVLQADIELAPWPLVGRRFGGVVVTHYLWRPLWPMLLDSLAEGGVLIYETFNVDHARIGKPSNPQFLLAHGELLTRTGGLRVVAYEDGRLTDPERHVQRIAAVRLAPAADGPAHLSAPPATHAL